MIILLSMCSPSSSTYQITTMMNPLEILAQDAYYEFWTDLLTYLD